MARVTVTNPSPRYNTASNGSAQSAFLVKGDVTNPKNILGRVSNVNWNVGFGISDVPEINTSTPQETVYGRANLISGQIGVIMTGENNDQLTTSRTMKDDEDGMTLFVESGDDHPLTTVNPDGSLKRVISDVFTGVKISNKSGGIAVNQLRMTNVAWIALDHMTGAEWKKMNASASYPATVS